MGIWTLFAVIAACGLGIALVFTKLGLRYVTARAGAAISIPTATLLFWCAAPFAWDGSGWSFVAILIFALVGVFFPALVTLLVFAANDRMGPTIAGTISSTTPLFAAGAAIVFLDEALRPLVGIGALTVVGGIAALTWQPRDLPAQWPRTALGLPILAAAVRGLSQAIVKGGLNLWPNPYAAALIGYSVSTAAVIAASRVARHPSPPAARRKGAGWFALAGVSNGGAVLAMYHALEHGSVTVVSTIVAAHPFIALVLGAFVLRFEMLTIVQTVGVLLAVGGVILVIVG